MKTSNKPSKTAVGKAAAQIKNPTIKAMVKSRDWEGIQGLFHATSRMHGLPTIGNEAREIIIRESAKDGFVMV